MDTLDELLEQAVKLHHAGQLDEAEALYRQILASDPNDADALQLLGMVQFESGKKQESLELLRRALEINPQAPDCHFHLGFVLADMGEHDQAIAAFRQAVILKPDFAEALHYLGMSLREVGQLWDGVEAIRQSAVFKPQYMEALNNLGVGLRSLGDLDGAIEAYRQALRLRSDVPEVYNNLGNVLLEKGEVDESIAALRKALALRPAFAEARSSLGRALQVKGQFEEAVELLQQSWRDHPDSADMALQLGNALQALGRLDEAIAAYGDALALRPDHADTHQSLGNALQMTNRLDEAIAAYRRALELQRDFPDAYNNMGNALLASGHLEEAIRAFHNALELQPDAPGFLNNLGRALQLKGDFRGSFHFLRRALNMQPNYLSAHSNLLYVSHFHPDFDSEAIYQEHLTFNREHAQRVKGEIAPHRNDPSPDRRLKIGYVSPDFREHSVAFFLRSLLGAHDPNQVEVFCYAENILPDEFTARFQQSVHHWRRTAGLGDAQVAQMVRDDQIDILVDLAGHSAGNRLLVFARKPAPVQVTYLGYPDTTGLTTMDYRFTDANADPPGLTEQFHTEKLIRLPQTFACYCPPDDAPPLTPLPALAAGHVTFGSFGNIAKVTNALLDSWGRILGKVPASRLIMVARGLRDESLRQRIIDTFERHGIQPERLSLHERQPLAQYLAVHQQVDVVLDTYPVNGHTTTCHALWMGVPVVCLAGNTPCRRLGASVLNNLDLSRLIAQTPRQYEQIAVELAGDLPRLAELRAGMRDRMARSPLMDAAGFARNVEAAYRDMWRQWCSRQRQPP